MVILLYLNEPEFNDVTVREFNTIPASKFVLFATL